MVSHFAKKNLDLFGATLKKHSMFMRIHPPGLGRPVDNLDMGPWLDVNDQSPDPTTPEGGQVLQFDQDGLLCHLTDDSAMYHYESHNNLLRSCPFTTPIIHIDEYELPILPDIDDYLMEHIGDTPPEGYSYEDDVVTLEEENGTPVEQVVNWTSASTLPPTPTKSTSGKRQST
jgi:hypothetical protein